MRENLVLGAEYYQGDPDVIGLEQFVCVNTDRCCAKELVLLTSPTCPRRRHPEINGKEGKRETENGDKDVSNARSLCHGLSAMPVYYLNYDWDR